MGDLITGIFPEEIEPWKLDTIVDPLDINKWKHWDNISLLKFDDSESEILQDNIIHIVDRIIDEGIDMYQKMPKIGIKNTIQKQKTTLEFFRKSTTEIWNQAFIEWTSMQDAFELLNSDNVNFPENFIIETITELLSKYREVTCKILLGIDIEKEIHQYQSKNKSIEDPDILFCIQRIMEDGFNKFIEARPQLSQEISLYSHIREQRAEINIKAQWILSLFRYLEKLKEPHQQIELDYKLKFIEYSLGHYREIIFEHLCTIFPQR